MDAKVASTGVFAFQGQTSKGLGATYLVFIEIFGHLATGDSPSLYKIWWLKLDSGTLNDQYDTRGQLFKAGLALILG